MVVGSVDIVSGLQMKMTISNLLAITQVGWLFLTRPQASGKWFMLHRSLIWPGPDCSRKTRIKTRKTTVLGGWPDDVGYMRMDMIEKSQARYGLQQ